MRAVHSSLLALALAVHDARGALLRRAAPTSSAGIHQIPVYMSDSGQYMASANMGSGDLPQHLNFTFAGSMGYIVVAGSDCTACNTSTRYDPSKSSSFVSGSVQDVKIHGAVTSVKTGRENCSFVQTDGSDWLYPNQTIAIMSATPGHAETNLFQGDSSGIVGLGTSFVPNFGDSLMGGWLTRNPTASNLSIGLGFQLPPGDSLERVGSDSPSGSFYILGPDHTASTLSNSDLYNQGTPFVGTLTTVTAHTLNNSVAGSLDGGSDVINNSDWAVNLDGWTLSSSKANATGGSGSTAIIEPGYNTLIVPHNDSQVLFAALGATANSAYNTNVMSYNVPCDALFGFSVSFGGVSFLLDRRSLVIKTGDTCQLTIQCWTDPTVNTYVMGTPFLQNAFVVFTASQKNSQDGNTFTFGQLNRFPIGSPSHTGAIIGGTVGGVVGLIFLSFILYHFFLRSRLSVFKRKDHSEMAQSGMERPTSYSTYAGAPVTPTSELPSLPNSAASDQPFLKGHHHNHSTGSFSGKPGATNGERTSGYELGVPDFGPRYVDMWISRSSQHQQSQENA